MQAWAWPVPTCWKPGEALSRDRYVLLIPARAYMPLPSARRVNSRAMPSRICLAGSWLSTSTRCTATGSPVLNWRRADNSSQ